MEDNPVIAPQEAEAIYISASVQIQLTNGRLS